MGRKCAFTAKVMRQKRRLENLPSKYFYEAEGSLLFEAIWEL